MLSLAIWVAILLLPWQPHRTRERFETSAGPSDLSDLTVLVPARNEAENVGAALEALGRQGEGLLVRVIDDESTDATADIVAVACAELAARRDASLTVELVRGRPLPPGWGGKLWALQQGLEGLERPYTLLLDADIEIDDGFLPGLVELAKRERLQLVSIMARLRCRSFWERLLVPPFIFFFKLLYPFALVNSTRSRIAAAAGGCMLIETRALGSVGGFEPIRGALIDDCSLARLLKRRGLKLWLGLSRSVRSRRRYARLGDFWQMVSRTAFTQLRYSALLLVATTAIMLLVFAAPVASLFLPDTAAVAAACLALAAMSLSYLPVVRFYELPLVWVLTLPVAAALFLAMTWTSAMNYWQGTRAQWKDRSYDAAGR